MSYRFGRPGTSPGLRRRDHPALRLLRRLAIRLPRELVEWVRAFQVLKGTRMLVMTGTGMLGDFGIGPLDLHYEILKWSIVARLRGCKLLFVSVGAGPIRDPLSRWIVKSALSLAAYRSYRDPFSHHYLASIGFDTSRDRVCPDLAFSLEGPAMRPSANGRRGGEGRVIGIGLMEYYGQHRSPEDAERVYQRYVEPMAVFTGWLLQQGHSVRLLVGDVSYDTRVTRDVLRLLEDSGWSDDSARIIQEPLASPRDLYVQLARTDMVVATRFHNVVLALMLGKPVIALSYHEKLRSLMAGVGADEYCVDAEDLDVARLIERFESLARNAELLSGSARRKTDEYRIALDEQYGYIFGDLLQSTPRPAVDGRHAKLSAGPSAAGVRGRVA
jgi:polysaccharide pyruvyl transferase WcaK-like protein